MIRRRLEKGEHAMLKIGGPTSKQPRVMVVVKGAIERDYGGPVYIVAENDGRHDERWHQALARELTRGWR